MLTKATMQLTSRQKLILTLIIHEHIHSAQPVGSKTLVDKYELSMSSATVRNENGLSDRSRPAPPAPYLGRPGAHRGGLPFLRRESRPQNRAADPTPAARSSTSSISPARTWNSGSNWRRPSWRTSPRRLRWSQRPTRIRRSSSILS